jgi:hypothetical protein
MDGRRGSIGRQSPSAPHVKALNHLTLITARSDKEAFLVTDSDAPQQCSGCDALRGRLLERPRNDLRVGVGRPLHCPGGVERRRVRPRRDQTARPLAIDGSPHGCIGIGWRPAPSPVSRVIFVPSADRL